MTNDLSCQQCQATFKLGSKLDATGVARVLKRIFRYKRHNEQCGYLATTECNISNRLNGLHSIQVGKRKKQRAYSIHSNWVPAADSWFNTADIRTRQDEYKLNPKNDMTNLKTCENPPQTSNKNAHTFLAFEIS